MLLSDFDDLGMKLVVDERPKRKRSACVLLLKDLPNRDRVFLYGYFTAKRVESLFCGFCMLDVEDEYEKYEMWLQGGEKEWELFLRTRTPEELVIGEYSRRTFYFDFKHDADPGEGVTEWGRAKVRYLQEKASDIRAALLEYDFSCVPSYSFSSALFMRIFIFNLRRFNSYSDAYLHAKKCLDVGGLAKLDGLLMKAKPYFW